MTARTSLPRILLLQHELFTKTLHNRLLLAPVVSHPAPRVLDIGTGCGIWAADFAAAHPDADVIGIDNYPQPKIEAPPNCRFVELDAEGPWDGLGDGTFDLIHTRLVPFHRDEIEGVLERCHESLNAGGWIEMQEAWPPLRTDEPAETEHESRVVEWSRLRVEAAARLGIDQGLAGRLPGLLAAAGFVDVQIRNYKWPVGTWMEEEWMKDIGKIHLELLQIGMMGLSKELLTNLGMGEQEVVVFVELGRNELGVGKIYAPVRVVCARKPGGIEAHLTETQSVQ